MQTKTQAGRRRASAHARPRRKPSRVFPTLCSVVLGIWAGHLYNNHGHGVTAAIVFGLVSAAVLMAVCLALHAVGPSLPKEVRAALWGLVAGGSMGALISFSATSVLTCVVIGLFTGIGFALAKAYRLYNAPAS